MHRLATCWIASLLLWSLACAGTLADIPGSSDHPLLQRYPGSSIQWYRVDNHRAYKVPAGPVSGYRQLERWIESEGRLTRIYYTLDGGGRSDSEVWRNYRDALATAGFEMIAEGYVAEGVRGGDIGSRAWQDVVFRANPWGDSSGAVNEMARGSATAGGSGSVVARKQNAGGTAYVVVSVYQFRADRVAILVDVLEMATAQTGLIAVDAEAIGAALVEQGRVVLDGLHFDHDRATLTARSEPVLAEIARYLAAHPQRQFHVVGHTDGSGALEYNRKLSAERAAAVVQALVERHGIAAARLQAHGVGPLAPRASNGAEAGRERNRRVELVER